MNNLEWRYHVVELLEDRPIACQIEFAVSPNPRVVGNYYSLVLRAIEYLYNRLVCIRNAG